MLTQLLRFECLYHIKQPSFIISLLVSLFYGVAINADSLGPGMALLDLNSPYRVSFFIALTSVLSIFGAMIFCVNSLLRDREHHFDSIVGMLAIKQRVMSRVIAIGLSTLCVTSMVSIGMMLGLLSPSIDQEKVAHFSLLRYLWPWLVFVFPNTIIVTSLLVAITLKKQTAFTTYTSATLLFVLFWVAMISIGAPLAGATVIKDPSIVGLFSLLDPFGASAFFEQSAYWTPLQKNQLQFNLSGSLLANRILWLSIALWIIFYLRKHILEVLQPRNEISIKTRKGQY